MARLQLNKSSMARETANLKTYKRFLPSLDLKRQQLMAERVKAARALADLRTAIDDLRGQVGRQLPMLANQDIDLADLAEVRDVTLVTENVVGTRLPAIERVDIAVRRYPLLARPRWVDAVATKLRDMLEMRIREQVAVRRLALLDAAVDTITQRVNLFDKVLIPRTESNIKRIRIYLSDEEMAAVVRSKISKRKHAAARAA